MWHIEVCSGPCSSGTRRQRTAVTHVVTDPCIKCKYTDCVDVCPVDCFREGPDFLVIDPDECIDCAVCIPECPVNAIYAGEDTPDAFHAFLELNARLSRQWPVITKRMDPAPEAAQWRGKTGKLAGLDPALLAHPN